MHDEDDPVVMPSHEEAWSTAETSADPAGAGIETAGDAPSSAAQDLPAVTEQVMLGGAGDGDEARTSCLSTSVTEVTSEGGCCRSRRNCLGARSTASSPP